MPNRKQISFTFSEETVHRLREFSEKEDLPVSRAAERLIAKGLDEHGI